MASAEELALQTKIAALYDLIATGRRSIMFSDRSETYNSVEEIQAAITILQGKLRNLTTTRPKQFLVVAGKGF